jgi:hypothetical protein
MCQTTVLVAMLFLSVRSVHAQITVNELGAIEAIREGEHRLGAIDRMFLIEDQWELDRCASLLPKLPKVDLKAESLLVITSWKYTARTLKGVQPEGDTLAIKIDQAKPPAAIADSYHPPKFLVFKIPTWHGPVRFEVNGEPSFTIPRGEALVRQSEEVWEEILRIHSGGRPKPEQIVRYYKLRSPDASEQEIKRVFITDKRKYLAFNSALLYPMLFRDLIDVRARPVIPRIFDLIESMGQHDNAFEPAFKAVVGIGGPDVLDHCKKGLKSWNPRSRHAAMLILRDLSLPDSRPLAHEHLGDVQQEVARCALDLLHHIGTTKEDVPAMIRALEEIERYHNEKVDE